MTKTLPILTALMLALTVPAYAGDEHGHGSASDDHSAIKALDVSPEEALATLESGLTALSAKIEANATEDVVTSALALMSAVKTLQDASPGDRQAAALKQLDGQLDAAKHAGEDKDMAGAKSAVVKAQSALKLYNAVK